VIANIATGCAKLELHEERMQIVQDEGHQGSAYAPEHRAGENFLADKQVTTFWPKRARQGKKKKRRLGSKTSSRTGVKNLLPARHIHEPSIAAFNGKSSTRKTTTKEV